MASYLGIAFSALLVAYAVHTYRCLTRNIAAAQRSGVPYIVQPVFLYNRFWLITHPLFLPFFRLLPRSWTYPWLE